MPEPSAIPAAASTALHALLAGPARVGTVLGSTGPASYVALDGQVDVPVLALVVPGAVRLPVAVLVPHLPTLAEGSPVRVGSGLVRAGGQAWHPVRWWDPVPRLDVGQLRDRGGRLLDALRGEPASAYGVDVGTATAAVRGLAADDPHAVDGLLGVGPGLTPAGDDVVAGALAALALLGTLKPGTAATVTALARSRTTTLSAALLLAAARSQVIPEAARTLRAVAGGGDVTQALAGLLAVGATSGHALALGLAVALHSGTPTSDTRQRVLEAT